MSTVYFLRVQPRGAIKIGFTEGCVYRRVEAIQATSPHVLKWIGAFRGEQADETAAHRQFRAIRIRGEWFKPTPELLAFVTEKTPEGFDPAAWRDNIFMEPERQIVLAYLPPYERDNQQRREALCSAIGMDVWHFWKWVHRDKAPDPELARKAAAYVLSATQRVAA